MIKVLEKKKNQLKIEIDNLTIVELLRKLLWEDKNVEMAAWRREHPTKNPILTVRTKGKSPKKALLDCIARIGKINTAILKEFKKAVK